MPLFPYPVMGCLNWAEQTFLREHGRVEDHQGAPENFCTERYPPGDSGTLIGRPPPRPRLVRMEELKWGLVSFLPCSTANLLPFSALGVLRNAKAAKPKRFGDAGSIFCDWELKARMLH